jgi:enoyl-CoA hydratase/carnithine racemase
MNEAPISFRAEGAVGFATLCRPGKRNALNDQAVLALEHLFSGMDAAIRAVVLSGDGEHFSAGLDLSELRELDAAEGIAHSAMWHRAFQAIEFGRVPVVAALHGAVVGGGLELACATHVRVADETAYYALPEGQRGIFVGGGGSVRLPRLIGVSRMQEMMLTGRTYGAVEGLPIGFSHYVVPPGAAIEKATALARRIAENAPLTNFAVMHALPRIAGADPAAGYLAESLMAALAQGAPEAKQRLRAFLDKKAGKIRHGG